MAEIVYVLCALTSLSCALLLLRGFTRARTPLLFWSFASFACFTVTNILLFFDYVIVRDMNLSGYRDVATLIGLGLLLYGMIWRTN